MRRLVLIILFATLSILPLDLIASAQKSQSNKFPHAIERSRDAARIVPVLSVVPEDGVPKELLDKAQAIGVFPKVERETAYFTHIVHGYGVISSRQQNGWTAPAFYEFMGSGFGNPFSEKENYGVVMLFMKEDALGWFEKGGVSLKDEKKAVVGPVGTITDEQRKALDDTNLLAYVYYNGKLTGTSYGKRFGLNPDNKINTPLYGMKGREVLSGKKIDSSSLPDGITAFQESLQKYYPGR
jgi:lipid-binding SYLF domain-containing protein